MDLRANHGSPWRTLARVANVPLRLTPRSQKRGAIETISAREKDGSIETLRGLAVFLLVSYHCVDDGALELKELSYGYMGYCFRWLRMPLFTAISGYVFALRPLERGSFLPFLRGKSRRLLLPWISVTVITIAASWAVGKSSLDGLPWRALTQPIGHLWFLPAIFWVFVLTGLLELRGQLATYAGWLRVAAVACAAAIFLRSDRALAIDGAIMLLPFFLVGFALQRFEVQLLTRTRRIVFAAIALISLALHQCMWWTDLTLSEYPYNTTFLLAGLSVQSLLFYARAELPLLPRVGIYAFPIYLYHILAISLGTRVAKVLHVEDQHAVFMLKLLAGLVLPVLLARALWYFPLARLILLGERSGARESTDSMAPNRARPSASTPPAADEEPLHSLSGN